MGTLVRINNVSKHFGDFVAVDNVSFSVDAGEIVGFLGPNGAGKTTTMRMATGFINATSGSIEINGCNIASQAVDARKSIGYLPEGGPLYPDMTPDSFLRFIAAIRGLEGAKLKERLDFVVDSLHLSKVYYQSIDTLSKGFKRRVALAHAILHDPKVLILDEPTDGLDPNQKHEVQKLITSMAKDKAVIISTHILEEVDAICSRTVIISSGKIVAEGTPKDIAAHSPKKGAVILGVTNLSANELKNQLEGDKQIQNIEVCENNQVLVYPKKDVSIFSHLVKLAQKHKWDIDVLQSCPGQLNEAFRALTISGE